MFLNSQTDMPYRFTYREIAEALQAALRDDPFFSTMERSVSQDINEAKEAMIRYMDYSMVEARKYGELYLPEGKHYGASIWSKPLDEKLARQKSIEKKTFIQEHMREGSLKTYSAIVTFMSEQANGLLPENIWYLSILAIDPVFQGQGLGTGLVETIIGKADGMGIPTYLETYTPENKTFYKRLGYRETALILEPVTGARYSIMIREPA
jgi:GNAT superfamily N-acetyltransferase